MSDPTAPLELGCKVSYGLGKRGTVRFVGPTDFADGEWVGLELERAEGRNNGEINGRVYFQCAPNHGLFVKRSQIRGVLARAPAADGAATPTRRLSGVGARSQDATDRRLSGVSSRLRPPSAAANPSSSSTATSGPSSIPRATTPVSRTGSGSLPLSGSGGLSRTGSGTLPPAGSSSPLATTPTRAALRSSISVPPSGAGSASANSSANTTPVRRPSAIASASSRLSLDAARRTSINRTSSSASDDQLVEANARIAKLEEELEQKNRHVEQLKQSVVIMKEQAQTAAAAAAAAAASAASASKESEGGQEDNDTTEKQAEDQNMEEDESMDVDESGDGVDNKQAPSPEELLAKQVDAVKQEADEHVKAVRSELEDHIAQLQREHEELQDELRLENATQASEIKSLEAEIAQQKARIAQFTAAEQKKAEEVALAVAKSSKGERRVEALEAQITEFQDMVEMMTLEKETLEMDKEIAEERVEELQQEVEKLKASMALAAAAPERSGDESGPSSSEIAEENKKLRAAVKALHERSSEERAELSKKVRQLQRENTELVNLREEVEQLTVKRAKLEEEAEELKEMLDVANAYESMVEDLTEKNLTLGEKVAELETTVQSLEALREMDQEMEHQHTEYEAELRDEIESQRSALQELKQIIADLKTSMEDKDRTIARFREHTQSNREEINALKAKLRVESGELESLKGTTHMALNQTMSLRSLVASARESEIEAAKQKIHAEQARIESTYLRALIPSSIFTETDQKVLRVRLVLGRIAGKASILLDSLRKDVDNVLQQDGKDEANATGPAAVIPQLLLADKIAAVFCQAEEDRFMLECHLTTEEEFTNGVAQLDTVQISALESLLDAGLAASLDGTLLVSRSGEASISHRLAQVSDEWLAARYKAAAEASEGFPARCTVVKLRSRRSVASLSFSLSASVSAVRSAKLTITSPGSDAPEDLKTNFVPVLDVVTDELLAIVNVAQLFYRRAEIDLATSDDDLEGLVAVGGDVVEITHSCSMESQGIWSLVQENLSQNRLSSTSSDELVAFVQESLLKVLGAFKDKLMGLFKFVCRGAFTDAVAPRTHDRSATTDGRPQWQIRARAIHSELLGASALRAKLNETTELCQALHTRIRELERAESQARVVTQKLESEVLRLSNAVMKAGEDKAQMEEQMAKEREQFNSTLDGNLKEKMELDRGILELRKQLKRATEATKVTTTSKSAMSAGDMEAFRKAFESLHDELDRMRTTLAKERLDRVLGPSRSVVTSAPPQTDKLMLASKELRKLTRQVKAELSMPKLVDLRNTSSSGRAQLVTHELKQSKAQQSLSELRAKIGGWMKEDGWGEDVTRAISRGETVFGWQPPEMERPPLLVGRVTLAAAGKSSPNAAGSTVQLVMDRAGVQRLTQTLAS